MRAFVLAFFFTVQVFGMSSGDFRARMEAKEQAAYLAGVIDMAAAADTAKSQCISDWYDRSNGEAQKQIAAAMKQYPDRQPVALIRALVALRCK